MTQNEQLSALLKSHNEWVDDGSLLDMAYVRKHNLSLLAITLRLYDRYPYFKGSHTPVLEKIWKGIKVVVIERKQMCRWRFSRHWRTIREYAVGQGNDWKIYGKLADIRGK